MKKKIGIFTVFELCLWITSMLVVTVSFFFSTEQKSILSLFASLFGVTGLIFVAKGRVIGQALMIVFAVLYGIVSWRVRYYGEMITYLCMSLPAAVIALISWATHPYKQTKEVAVGKMSKKHLLLTFEFTAIITTAFYFILKALDTSELVISTFSVATSFFAAYLTYRRIPYYGIAYATNDVVLIVLWIIKTVNQIRYLPMVFCFIMFLFNDVYGFINWSTMKKKQEEGEEI